MAQNNVTQPKLVKQDHAAVIYTNWHIAVSLRDIGYHDLKQIFTHNRLYIVVRIPLKPRSVTKCNWDNIIDLTIHDH